MKIVQCWIEHPVRSLDQLFTYVYDGNVETGARVQVPFGASRSLVGFVDNVTETDETKEQIEKRLGMKLKNVISVLDEESLITNELHDLALWMREMTLSTAIACFQAMLPAKVKPVTSGHHIVMEKYVRISGNEVILTPRQLQAYRTVLEKGEMKYSELRSQFPNQCRILVEKGAVEIYEKEKEAASAVHGFQAAEPELTTEQRSAMDEILSSDDRVYLLHGVTGSGKTEVYLRLARKALDEGKQVLILVPEISLTPQMISRVSSRFGSDLAIYHSGLNAQQKYEQYRKVRTGKARIVVGTRSAVFMPFSSLGLIILDEEHDPSYKQDNQPAYHARDIAVWRGTRNHCKVILGSATPSLESYARGLKNVYHLVTLKQRVNKTLPEVTIVPMKQNIRSGGSAIISDVLKQKIRDRLDRGEQTILLLNRRGYHAVMRCRSCQEPLVCPHCDIAMSYHREIKRMKCHTCGAERALPKVCPECGSTDGFASFGFGTEKLEQEVHDLFPGVRTLRMDADTTSRKDAHARILEAFGRGEADILLGTQMIAKGLDYPGVTLVGVVNGDEGLRRTDFRSCEITFDLLMQAGGRSGRGEQNGEVVYQVFNPDHYAVTSAAEQDYITFFRNEMKFRHAGQYPPYTYMIALTVSGKNSGTVDAAAMALHRGINGNFKNIGVISLLKIQDRCRSRVILKGKNLDEMRSAVRVFLKNSDMNFDGLRIDIEPMTLD